MRRSKRPYQASFEDMQSMKAQIGTPTCTVFACIVKAMRQCAQSVGSLHIR